MRLNLHQVLEATGGAAGAGSQVADRFTSFHTDSREVAEGGLFFALRGAGTDGHRYVEDAIGRGAAGVVVAAPTTGPPGVAVIQVRDTWRALYDLAGRVLADVAPLVVGITGSNGKTSTRELTAAVLATRHSVLATAGNLNTETGVPLTILLLEPEHTALVLEMGMQGPGEIARLADLAQPVVGIVTGVGTVHMEFFKSRDDLARAKGELVAALPGDGLAVLNADDAYCGLLRGLTRAPVRTFGLGPAVVQGTGYHLLPGGGCRFDVSGLEVKLAMEGRHQARNALAALAAGDYAGVPLDEGARALAGVRLGHRLEEVPGPNGSLLVDDSYNASPESMLAAFEVVNERARGARLLGVLGEMRELGSLAEAAHHSVGEEAGRLFDALVVVDVGHGRTLAEAAGADLVVDTAAAAEWVRSHAGPGDVVLIKASNGVRLHDLVALLSPPE